MNHVYRLVWNDRLFAYVPAPEFARGRGKKSFRLRALSAAVLASVAVTAHALPDGGQVSAGQGSIAQSGSAMTVTQQSPRLAINWQNFGIGANESVVFAQPNASAIALNRVLGSDPSQILGRLSANGQVWILNPNGLLFGSSAQINVGGLIGSTLQINDADFLAGKRTFSGNGGTVTNQGSIIAADGGYVALFGGRVSNEGVIQARLGTVALGAGNQVTLDFAGVRLLNLQVDQGAVNALVRNKQLIQADGGTVLLTAKAVDALLNTVVNNEGIIEARTIDARNGTIKLLGGMDGGTVQLSGTLDASAPNGGDGGFIETSGAHVKIANSARITTAAAQGKTGQWLIDPADYTIAASDGDITGATLATQLGSTDVTILSSQGTVNPSGGNGDIFANDAVSWNSANSLTLNAIRNINVNQPITNAGSGGVNLYATGDVTIRSSNVSTNGAVAVTGTNLNVVSTTAPVLLQGAGMTATISGDINVVAGTGSGSSATIGSTGTQGLSANRIFVSGGASGTQNNASIIASGGDQQITLTGTAPLLKLTGGGSGASDDSNWAHLTQQASLGNQTITINGGGTVQLTGGNGSGTSGGTNPGSNNHAFIFNRGTGSQELDFVAGGSLVLTGGTTGSRNFVFVQSAGPQTIIGVSGITLTGGSSGGGLGTGNFADIIALGNQNIGVGSGGLTLTGGSGMLTDNSARVQQLGTTGTSQTITVSGGGMVTLQGGSSAQTNVGSTHGSYADIYSTGDSQQVNFSGGGAINLTGGTAGSSAYAQILTLTGSQTISGSPSITVTGGASGGVSAEGNYAQINSGGAQNVSASGITLAGGAGGTNNNAQISSNGGQQISTSTSAGITIRGGAGTSYGNFAQIYHGTGGGNQAISINGGSVALVAGSGNGTTTNNANLVNTVCASDPNCLLQPVTGDWAGISSGVGNQSLSFQTAAGVLSITGGSGGNENKAYISSRGAGTQTVAGFPNITLTGGASGGNNYQTIDTFRYLLNNASIFSPGGAQTIQANSLTLKGMSAGADPATQASAVVLGYGQDITVTNAIALNSGSSANANTTIRSLGGQTISAGSLALAAGSGVGNGATIQAVGMQSIGANAIMLQGGASGNNNNANISGNGQDLTVGSGGIQIAGGAGGSNNGAGINQNDPSGAQTIGVTGGNVSVTGGRGAGNWAQIWSNGSGLQSISANGIMLQAGASGQNNWASINSFSGTQQIATGSLNLSGGGSTSVDNSNMAMLMAADQTINVTGNLTLTAGGNGSGNEAHIMASGNQTVSAGGTLALTAGGNGFNNNAYIQSNANQTISANGIMLSGGASGQNNWASIDSFSGTQRITTGSLNLTGGGSTSFDYGNMAMLMAANQTINVTGNLTLTAGGIGSGNEAHIQANAGQTISANGIILQGGASGNNNIAHISGNSSSGGQTLTVGSGGIQIAGGAGGSNNGASINQNDPSGTQSIVVSGGSVSVLGGAGDNNWAQINGNGLSQSITANGLVLVGGASGANNQAQINVWNSGESAQNITVGAEGISVTGGGGAGGNNFASISFGGATGTQSIAVTGGNVRVLGGSGNASNNANINSSAVQSIVLTNSNNLSVIAADGAANINSQGDQTIRLSGNGSNAIQVGDVSSAVFSGISVNANAAQSITAGNAGESGSITITGGSFDGAGSSIGNNAGMQSIGAAGNITIAGGSAPSTGTWSGISTGGAGQQSITANGLVLVGGASGANNTAQINAGNWNSGISGQSITVGAGGISLAGGSGAGGNNSVSIWYGGWTGTQSIAVTGGNVQVLGGSGNATNNANINSSAAQSITLTNANNLNVIAAAGSANISSQGDQTISLSGSGSNAIQVGKGTSAEFSSINANGGSQSITAGDIGQRGSITLLGGAVAGKGANIGTNFSATTQTISTSGMLTLVGGSATAFGNFPCQDEGACVSINNGSGLQSISAHGIVLKGGASGNNNTVNISGSNSGSGGQTLTVGSGGIQIAGGAGGSNNTALIGQNSPSGVQSIVVTGGNVSVLGGAGNNNWAQINSNGLSQSITADGLVLAGGARGGNNTAQINVWNSGESAQSITVGTGGIQVIGGAGGGGSGGNDSASISFGGATGTQSIAVTGGDVLVLGGIRVANNNANISSSAAQSITLTNSNNLNVIAADGGANISSQGAQTIRLSGNGSNAIQVGDVSSAVFSNINANGAQSITAGNAGESGSITIAGGSFDGAGSSIGNNFGTQSIGTAGTITIAGGGAPSTGTWSGISINGAGQQSVTANGLVLVGGASGANNTAQINAGNGGSSGQSITVGAEGISLTGGSGAGGNNSASIWYGGWTGTQSIAVTGGNVQVLGGSGNSTNSANINSSAAQSIALTNANNLNVIAAAGSANISSQGDQTIRLSGIGSNAIQVGNGTSAEFSSINMNGGSQSITAGDIGQRGSITLLGGAVAGKGVNIGTNFGATTQTISTSGMLTLVGGSATALGMNPCMDEGSCVSVFHNGSGLQSISAHGIVVKGGASGNNNTANIDSIGGGSGGQSIVAGTGGIQIIGGAGGSNNSAWLGQNNFGGYQAIAVTGGNVSVLGGAAGNNSAQIYSNAPSQNITLTDANALDVIAGASSADINSQGAQTISLNGTGASAIHVGNSLSTAGSQITSNGGAQNIAARSVTIQGGRVAGANANIGADNGATAQTISATGAINVIGGTAGGAQAQIYQNGTGLQSIGANQISLQGGGGTSGTGSSAAININGSNTAGQIITAGAGGISLTGGTGTGGGNSAVINEYNGSAAQTINVNGGNLSLHGGTGNGGNIAQIHAMGHGGQTISLANSGSLDVVAGGASASIWAMGGGMPQTITVGGTIHVGSASSAAESWIQSNGSQSITAGSIMIQGGAVAGRNANIGVNGGGTTQSLSTTGTISLIGGSATAVGTNPCVDEGVCVSINNNGSGLQSISANGIVLHGGASGNHNTANIVGNGLGGQSLTVGGGGIQITGGTGDSNNSASIGQNAPSAAQSIVVTGGNISLVGGAGGARNFASINSNGAQYVSASGIALTGGASGGGFSTGNYAQISASGNQSMAVGSGGLSLIGGGGTLTDNYALVLQGGLTGTHQTISVGGGGAITLQAGSSAQSGIGTASGHGSFAFITANGDSQQINFTAPGGAINAIGGTVGSRNAAGIQARNGLQTITGSPGITLTGGASGGADGEGNYAVITSSVGAQSITAGNTVLNAGAGGINNSVVVGAPSQNITVHGNLALTGGASIAGTVGAGARIGGFGGSALIATSLLLTVDGNTTLTGGSLANAGAVIGSTFVGGQTTDIAMTVGGSVTLNPGTVSDSRIGSPSGAVAGGNISITAGGGIFLNGSGAVDTAIRTAGDVTLHANSNGGTIGEAANGLIQANTLTTTSNGSTYLAGPNQVLSFNATTTVGDVALNNIGALNLTGLATGGNGNVVNAGAVTLSGPASANGAFSIAADSVAGAGGVSTIGGFMVDVANASWLSGMISGAGGLTKQGAGTLTLYGANSYSGDTNVNSGTLALGIADGTNTGTVNVASGAVFAGSPNTFTNDGVISGSGTLDVGGIAFTNNGTLRPGSAATIGTLTVAGNAVLGASSLLDVKAQGANQSDVVAITGNATLNGALRVTNIHGYSPTPGDRIVPVTFGSSAGALANVSDTWAEAYNPANVTLTSGRLNTWIGGTGNWTTLSNWSLGHLPLASEIVKIDVPGTQTVTLSGGTGAALKLVSKENFVISAGSLNLAGRSVFDGALTVTNGLLLGAGDVIANGAFLWSGGTLAGTGTLSTTALATLNPSAGNLGLNRNWTNFGQLNWQASANRVLVIGTGATLTNDASGTVVLAAALGGNIIGTGTLQNNGALAMNGSGVTLISTPFNDAGTVSVNSGTLRLSGNGSDSGSYSINSGAALEQTAGIRTVYGTVNGDTLRLSVGTLNINGGATLNTLGITSGTLGGSGNIAVNSAFNWAGGTLAGTGTLSTTNSALATLNPVAASLALNRNWTNFGQLNWQGSANRTLTIGTGATLTNDALGTVVLAAAPGSNIIGTGTLQNNGALAMNGAGLTVIGTPFNDAGTVSVNSGTLRLSGNGSDSGSYSINSGAALEQTAGIRTVYGTVNGDTLRLAGGTLNINGGGATLNTLGITSGTLGGSGNIGVNSAFNWAGGTLAGTGTLSTTNTALATLNPVAASLALNRNWTNFGQLNWQGSANRTLTIGTGATLTNDASGTVVLSAAPGSNITGAGTLQNNGALAMNGTGLTVIATPFNDAGTVSVNSGTLSLSGSGSDNGSYSINSGAVLQQTAGIRTVNGTVNGDTLRLAGGTLNLNNGGGATLNTLGIAVGTLNINGGGATLNTLGITSGTLGGSGNIGVTSAFNWAGGTLAGTGMLSTTNTALATLNPAANVALNRSWTNFGQVNWQGSANGSLMIGTGATLTNDALGTVVLSAATGSNITGGTFLNNGTLNMNGVGTTQILSAFTNPGLMNVNAGTLQLTSSTTNTGTININSGATLKKSGAGNYTNTGLIAGGGTFDTTGNTLINGGTVAPGGLGTIGTLTVLGKYQQTAGGMLLIDLAGTGAGQYDMLSVTGTATLGGTLSASAVGAYTPAPGHSFPLITYSSPIGGFGTTIAPSPYSFSSIYGPTVGTFTLY